MLSPVTQSPIRARQVARDLTLALATVVICAVPFLRQPFHMDDNFYMDMARNALEKPLYPNDTPYTFHGIHLADMGSHSHPPMQTYFLAVLQKSFGEGPGKEVWYHLSALLFPVLAVLAMYFLSIRFVENPMWPTVVLATSPVFMVMQHNLMADLPMLSFWLAALAAFLWATELRHRGLYLAGGLFAFAAMFTGYQAAALIPLLGFHLASRNGKREGVPALLLPLLLMTAWFLLQYLHYGRFLLWDTAGYVQSRDPLSPELMEKKILGILGYQGWLVIFPLFALLIVVRVWRGRALALAVLSAAYAGQLFVPDYRMVEKGIFIIGLTAGIALAGGMVRLLTEAFGKFPAQAGFPRAEARFLSLWYWGVMAYCILMFTEGSARYILPLVPPLLLCVFRRLEVKEVSEYRLGRPAFLGSAFLASGILVVSLAWALALSHADREFAGIYPRVASTLEEQVPGLPSYYAGEWGFRYYLRQSGVSQLPRDEGAVTGGSLVALPKLALPYDLPAALRSMMMPYLTITSDTGSPLRLLDGSSRAGFYSTGWGVLPFSISSQRIERVEVAQVNFMTQQLPWTTIETDSGTSPWPGYLLIDGKAPLAVLALPGTRILYAWRTEADVELELKCGVEPGAYGAGDRDRFDFEIRQLDSRGSALTQHTVSLTPGLRPEDRVWREDRLRLIGRGSGGESLEFRYSSSGAGHPAVGAFAEAILRKPR